MVTWSDKIDTEDRQECLILNEEISFNQLSGYVNYGICLLDILKTDDEILLSVINMFKGRLIQFKYYSIINSEDEATYLARILNLDKKEVEEVYLIYTTTDKLEELDYKRITVTLDEENTEYYTQLKKTFDTMRISKERKGIEFLNGMECAKYDCHVEVANSFSILFQALGYFLNSTSMRVGEYKYFDKIEIEKKLEYSNAIFKGMERRLEYLTKSSYIKE